MRKTQNAERDASILADHERGIRASDLMEHYGLSLQGVFAAIHKARKGKREKGKGGLDRAAFSEN